MGETEIPVVIMGLGEIGRAIARAVLVRPHLHIVGAVDPAHAGGALEDLVGEGGAGIEIAADAAQALEAARGGVVLAATSSRFEEVLAQLEQAVRAGVSVVSTCEELAYPWLRYEQEADALDRLCEERNVAVLGTGVNPGFVLDRLAAVLAHVSGPVRHVRGLRVVDAARRRLALRRKVGAGLEEAAFEAAVDRGEIGHVGLAESAALAAVGCGLADFDEVDEEIAPLLAEEDGGGDVPIPRGRVAGVHQVARVFKDDREVVRLELTIAVGADDPRDEVELDADPPVRVVVPGGISGDLATANAVANAAAAVIELRGLVTVLDLPAGR